MIHHLKGTVEQASGQLAVVDVGGVGYACNTSLHTIGQIHVGEKVKLYTYMYLREGICDLYGFAGQDELSAFKMLIGISGVGPKAAIAILSVNSPERLILSIITSDEKALTAASGIGKKIAQRIILELKDKLSKEQVASAGTSQAFNMPITSQGAFGEAQAALTVLGYSGAEIGQALKDIDQNLSVENIIKQALRKLASM